MKNVVVKIILLSAVFISATAYSAGYTSIGALAAIDVSENSTLLYMANVNNPDGCSNHQVLLLESSHAANKKIHSLASVALTTGMPVTFYVEGCASVTGQDTYPVVKSIKVEAQ